MLGLVSSMWDLRVLGERGHGQEELLSIVIQMVWEPYKAGAGFGRRRPDVRGAPTSVDSLYIPFASTMAVARDMRAC